jgi:hypothetical protein
MAHTSALASAWPMEVRLARKSAAKPFSPGAWLGSMGKRRAHEMTPEGVRTTAMHRFWPEVLMPMLSALPVCRKPIWRDQKGFALGLGDGAAEAAAGVSAEGWVAGAACGAAMLAAGVLSPPERRVRPENTSPREMRRVQREPWLTVFAGSSPSCPWGVKASPLRMERRRFSVEVSRSFRFTCAPVAPMSAPG